MDNRRRHKRFSATAFLNRGVYLTPLPPYFGHPVKGKLIDLSAGGMAILIDEIIPQGTNLSITATFPDGFKIECFIQIRHALPKNGKFLHGIEFLNLPVSVSEKIERMSSDYIDCEYRMSHEPGNVCRTDCAFYTMCTRPEKLNVVMDLTGVLEIAFRNVDRTTLQKSTQP
jgi:hypothetical protein